jgi:hypothetical protein
MQHFACILLLVSSLAAAACGGTSPASPSNSTGSTTSSAGGVSSVGRTSHNAGRDCTTCHSFTVAGTAYMSGGAAPYSGAVIKLTAGAAGSGAELATLTSDASGNFYTSAPVAFGSGVYAVATGTGGAARPMTSAVTSGACNRCHTSASRLTVG